MPVKATLRTPAKAAEMQANLVANVEVLKEVTSTPVPGVTVESTTTSASLEGASAGVDGSFDKELYGDGQPTSGVADAQSPATSAVATVEAPGPVARLVQGDENEFEGEYDQSDLKFPTLMIVQGTSGPLIEAGFAQGDLVFNNELLFPAPRPKEKSPELRVVPLHMVKSYREVLSTEQITDGAMARLFKTKAEVFAAGLSLQWFKNPDPCVRKSARLVLLIEGPEGTEHPGFSLELDGKSYAVGVYYAKTGAYITTADRVWNNYQTVLFLPVLGPDNQPVIENGRPKKRRCVYKNNWRFSWGQVKAGNYMPWRPEMVLTKNETGPDLREFAANLLRGRGEVAGE